MHDHEESHSHHHIHEHGEICDDPHCSCHDHAHHHEHHDHHHSEHDHHEPISVMSHDPATVGSVECTVPFPYEQAVLEVEKRMRAVADMVTNAGGFIGHIKALVEADTPRCRISITDDGVADKKWMDPSMSCKAECVFIVFGTECASLKHALADTFSDFLP